MLKSIKKYYKNFIFSNLTIISLMIAGCSTPPQRTTTFWINSQFANCEDSIGTKCLQVQRGDTVNWGNWELIQSKIDGFDYKEGYIYKITVSATYSEKGQWNYKLDQINQKLSDKKLTFNYLHGFKFIINDSITAFLDSLESKPFISFNLNQRRVSGSDGCNNFMGEITLMNFEELQFGTIVGTKKFCNQMTISDAIRKAVNQTHFWKRNGNEINFLDKDSTLILILNRIE